MIAALSLPIEMSQHYKYLTACKAMIEAKLAWGKSDQWSQRDFVDLGERIFAHTGIQLSPTTLKRIWGKVKYDNSPHPDTLQALAMYAGFANWREFVGQCELETAQPPIGVNLARAAPPKSKAGSRKWLFAASLFIAVGVAVIFLLQNRDKLDSADFSFESRQISSGLPNSVVFDYDAKAAPQGDSVFIQQSWDPRRRVAVDKNGKEHSSVYYYPGYFRAKLIVGKKVVREQDVFIGTAGWLAYIEQRPVPVYLKKSDFMLDSGLSVLPKTITQYNIPLQPKVPVVCLTDVKKYDGLTTDHFSLKARVRNHFSEGSGICQMTDIAILTKKGPLVFPLCSPGCVGDLGIHVFRHDIKSAQADLSGFGCNLREWVDFQCIAKSGHAFVFVNGKEIFNLKLPLEAAEIYGVQICFEGGGAVGALSLGLD